VEELACPESAVPVEVRSPDFQTSANRSIAEEIDFCLTTNNSLNQHTVNGKVMPFYRALATDWAVASEQNFRRIQRRLSLELREEMPHAVFNPE
jgi:hypothetical protein